MSTRIGFIGASADPASWTSRAHMPYLKSARAKELSHYTISAIQNSSVASGEKAAKFYGLDNVTAYDSSSSLASDPNVDMVAVSLKVPLHYDALLPALEAGKDVFCEWPLGRNLQEAERLTSLAKEKGVRTLVGLQARYNPSVVAVKRLVEEGQLGEILGTTMHGYGDLFGEKAPPKYAYLADIETGANLLAIPFSHAIDGLCWALGELESLQATLAVRWPDMGIIDEEGNVTERVPKTSHDYIAVTGTLKNGGGVVNVVYEPDTNPFGSPGFHWQINGTKGSLLLEGPSGHLQMRQPSIKFTKRGEKDAKDVEGVKWVGDDFSHGVGQAWEAFAGKGDGSLVTFEDALLRHKMIDAIYRSNQSGAREKYL